MSASPKSLYVNTKHFQDQALLFQKSLSVKFILNLWKSFREGGNLSEGKVNRNMFKRVMTKQLELLESKGQEADQLLDALFDRFKIEKFGQDMSKEEEKIDIQDLVVSLSILAHMDTEEKLELIFQLTDVDEDGCLSIEDIFQMIKRIERNFSKESAYINNDSSTLHHELSQRSALRKFAWATQKINRQGGDQKSYDLGLIERKSFLESLKTKEKLFESFLPQNFQLSAVLLNTSSEQSFEIFESTKVEFEQFRKEIHGKIRNDYKDKYSQNYVQEMKGVRFPGKIEVISKNPSNNEKKLVEVLSNFEKATDKKNQKVNAQNNGQNSKNYGKYQSDPSNKQASGQSNEETDSNNNLDIHKKRLKEMEEKSKGWTLGFKRNKYVAGEK